MSTNVHIEHICDTEANVRTNMDLLQIGIFSDQSEEFVWYNDDKTKLYYAAAQKYYSGAAFTYMDVDFSDVTARGNIYCSEYFYHYGDTDTNWRFQADQITATVGNITFMDMVEGATDYVQFGVNVGIGVAPGDDRLSILYNPVNDSGAYGIKVDYSPDVTGDGTYYYIGQEINLDPNVSAGVTNLGYEIGLNIAVITDTTFEGTLADLRGMSITYGNSTGTGTLTVATGLKITPFHSTGAIGTSKALEIAAGTTVITPTNQWAIYSAMVADSYFAGQMGFGVIDPDTQVEILYPGNQLKLSFDGTDNCIFAVDTAGIMTITPSGAGIHIADDKQFTFGNTAAAPDAYIEHDTATDPDELRIENTTDGEHVRIKSGEDVIVECANAVGSIHLLPGLLSAGAENAIVYIKNTTAGKYPSLYFTGPSGTGEMFFDSGNDAFVFQADVKMSAGEIIQYGHDMTVGTATPDGTIPCKQADGDTIYLCVRTAAAA